MSTPPERWRCRARIPPVEPAAMATCSMLSAGFGDSCLGGPAESASAPCDAMLSGAADAGRGRTTSLVLTSSCCRRTCSREHRHREVDREVDDPRPYRTLVRRPFAATLLATGVAAALASTPTARSWSLLSGLGRERRGCATAAAARRRVACSADRQAQRRPQSRSRRGVSGGLVGGQLTGWGSASPPRGWRCALVARRRMRRKATGSTKPFTCACLGRGA